jgi:hypothetical protein
LGSAVLRTNPFGKTNVIEWIVRYAFSVTPQHMPLELFARIPPIMQASMEAGSGPMRRLYDFKAELRNPPTMPG